MNDSAGSAGAFGNWLPGTTRAYGRARTAEATASAPARRWRQLYTTRLAVSDSLIVSAACGTVALSTAGAGPGSWPMGLLVALFWLFLLTICRTRSPQGIGVGAREYKRVIDASCIALGWFAAVALVAGAIDLRGYLLIAFPLGVAGLLIERWLWRHWLVRSQAKGHALSHVVIVGEPHDINYVVNQLEKNCGPAYKVVGIVLDHGDHTLLGRPKVPTYRGMDALEAAVADSGADAVVVAGHLEGGHRTIRDLGWKLEESRTEIILVSSLTNVAGPRIRMRPVEGLPLMHVDLPHFDGGHHVIKRIMDIVLSSVALLVLLPVFAVLAVFIKADSQGPVFFVQERVGRHGEKFRMFKFRSMCRDAESQKDELRGTNEADGPLFKMENDPRVTRVGRWMRKHSLDELPQFLNVLRGDMSMVGPRPPLQDEASTYAGSTFRRLYIKPGVTGLWQVNGRSLLSWEESVRLDLYYVENWSVTGDLMIMWRTFKVMIKPVGAF